MNAANVPRPVEPTNPWPLVLCLIGVDYFSTLAYLPSIAAEAAGPLAPVAAGGVVLVTFLLALPTYWYLVGRSPDGQGATGLLQRQIPGWRGKLVVLTLLGFAAADFVITRSLSLADAAIHLIHNPHGQKLLARLPEGLSLDDHALWPRVEQALRVVIEPQVAITLGLSIASLAAWQFLKRGVTRRILLVTTAVVCCYLALAAVVIGSAVVYIAGEPALWEGWRHAVFEGQVAADGTVGVAIEGAMGHVAEGVAAAPRPWWLAWLSVCLWSFPQMALGLSGFELIMTVAPRVSGGVVYGNGTNGNGANRVNATAGRVRNTRKLMVLAASIMAVYLVSAVAVTTLLVPQNELLPGGAAQHRALAYLAHGGALANGAGADGEGSVALSPMFGRRFGDLFDLSTVAILCLAGATVTMGLKNLLPHYLNRLGMEVSWAGRVGVILNVMNLTVLLVTVVFRASPSSQQWAYATSVLVLLAGGALAAGKDLNMHHRRGLKRALFVAASAGAVGFFLVMTGLTVLINHSGLTIALLFVAAILISSFVSRWIRSTELRFEGFDFADMMSTLRWGELARSGAKVLAPHRPGLKSLLEKSLALRREFRLDAATPLVFIEVTLGDPSNFYQKPLMKIEREGELEVIRVSKCVSVSHVLAAICLELCKDGGDPPEIIFGWSLESPLAANLNFLLLGEGNIPWMVKDLVHRAMPNAERQPRIVVG